MDIVNTIKALYYTFLYYKNMIKNRFSILIGIKRMDRRDIVRITGIDRHTINKIYKNETKGITFDTLNKLCFALDCTTNDLFPYVAEED